MEIKVVVETAEAIGASVAALAAMFRRGTDDVDSASGDLLRDRADACLDGMAELARMEAGIAALKVHLAAGYAETAAAIAPPPASPQEHTVQDMAVTAEVACVLTVSERTAGALLAEAHALTTALPLTLSALQAGSISWQHARVMVDEAANLDRAGAAGLEAHFLDADAPNPARGCPAGDLVPSRFRAKARTWRERHHPVSIEERHTKSARDRRIEYIPDRDGMAWLSAYLPADTAAAIWDRTTSAARALQGPAEARTLTPLRADIAATWLLTRGGTEDRRTDAGTGKAGDIQSPRAQVLITVPVLSLLGVTDEPAVLDGHGPIPPSMARALVADGASSFLRVLIDPRDGAPLASANEPPGWTSPAGRHYPSEQPDWEPPRLPSQILAPADYLDPGPPGQLESCHPESSRSENSDELVLPAYPGDANRGCDLWQCPGIRCPKPTCSTIHYPRTPSRPGRWSLARRNTRPPS